MKTLYETQSICPICQRALPARYREDGGSVYLEKTCPEHGRFESLAARSAEDFITWTAHPAINIPPKQAQTQGAAADDECPLHCGVCENHLQTACCVLIDITDRCNQRCPYCFARAEEDASADPPLAEIGRKYDLLLKLGEERPFNIQLSGGEPTVRDDLPEIVGLGRDKGFEYIQINTNGRRLALEEGYAKKLKRAGASVIYLQFDGTRDDIYQALRGEPLLALKEQAIENCRKAGLPVTLVPTVVKNVNLSNIGGMMEFVLSHLDVVKGIHFQPVSFFGRCPELAEAAAGARPADTFGGSGGRTEGWGDPVAESGESGEEARRGDFANRVTMFDVMHALEEQTAGKFRYDDFCPITAGHPLCCFYGTFRKQADGSVKSLLSEETKKGGVNCCGEPAAVGAGSSCGTPDPLSVIKKDRDFVLNKWDLPEQDEADFVRPEAASGVCCGKEAQFTTTAPCGCDTAEPPAMDFDDFLRELKSNLFTVSAMAFQDGSNLDANRLKRCRVQQLTADDRLIPFCAYNSIYR